MIVVGTTLAAYVCDNPDTSEAWLYNAAALAEQSPEPVKFFAALELDARGLAPFEHLLNRLRYAGGEHWTFHLDDGRAEITTANRLRHIVAGQNLVTDYAVTHNATHLLFLAADLEPEPATIPKLLEVNWPIVGGEVSTYCLTGPDIDGFSFPVQEHMATAAMILLRRDVFNQIRWRWDANAGMSDDPCMHHDAQHLLGWQTLVRKDCVGRHYPLAVGPIEGRGHNMKVAR